eukprot:m.89800 g.89800  ORF g.89800 m.89800 type:complete len:936 (+) comp13242_c0_seq1:3049-5856(+)
MVELWRKRLPNHWDEIETWQDLLLWRMFIFEKIAMQKGTTVKKDALTLAQNEMAWTMNQLGKMGREHRMKDFCEKTLNWIYKLQAVEPSDLFVKAREQVLCNMQLVPKDLTLQLDIINSTNLQYFKEVQSAEFFALKGVVMHKLNRWKEANKAFSTAVSLCDDLGMAWEAWAVYCDDMFKRVRESVRELKNSSGAKRPKTDADTESNAREWGKSAITCYLNACRSFVEDEKSKRMIARSLFMLSLDDTTPEIGNTFYRLAQEIETSVWRFWIPELIVGLSRPEAKVVQTILYRLAKYYPQALYCNLRTAFLEIRAADGAQKAAQQKLQSSQKSANSSEAVATARTEEGAPAKKARVAPEEPGDASPSKGKSSSKQKAPAGENQEASSTSQSRTSSALRSVMEVMQVLRVKHAMLATTMETMIEEIVVRFKASAEDEMLRTTRVLLTECLRQSFAAMDKAVAGQAPVEEKPVPQQVRVHLERMLSSYLTESNPSLLKYRKQFEQDFGNLDQINLDTCLRRLHAWHMQMTNIVSQLPRTCRLEDMSQFLTSFTGAHADIDLPGEHAEKHAVNQAQHSFVRIERFLPEVELVYSHSSASRRFIIRGRDGKKYPYLVRQSLTRHAHTEEHFLQLFRMVNTLLDKRKESRKRNLAFSVPRAVPLNTHVQLYQDDVSSLSLEDVFEEFCASSQMTIDQPVMDCYEHRQKDMLSRHTQGLQQRDIRKEIFDGIRRKSVPSDILSRFMRATFPDHVDLWMFQKQFSIKTAMMSFATYVFMMSKGAPHTMRFVLNTGNIVTWDLLNTFNQHGIIVTPEPIPFRLTPNIVNFITPVGITGLFSASMVAAAHTLIDPEFRIEDYLCCLFRDEMLSWFAAHHESRSMSAMSNEMLVEMVYKNVNAMKKQLEKLAEFDGTNQNVDNLIKHATTSQNLCLMPPTWHPWL